MCLSLSPSFCLSEIYTDTVAKGQEIPYTLYHLPRHLWNSSEEHQTEPKDIFFHIWMIKLGFIFRRSFLKPKPCGGTTSTSVQIWASNNKSLEYRWYNASASYISSWLHFKKSNSCVLPSALFCPSLSLEIPRSCQNPVVVHSTKTWSQFWEHSGLVTMSTCTYCVMLTTASHLFLAPEIGKTF